MIDNGYILLARKSINSDIWSKPPLYWKIWCFILMKAFYEDGKKINRGEFITTIDELIEAGSYNVGFRKIKPTAKQIRCCLDYLRKSHEGNNEGHMIGITKVTNGMLIKVEKYDIYQESQNYERHTKGTRKAHEGQNKGITNRKEYKEEKEEYISSDELKKMQNELLEMFGKA